MRAVVQRVAGGPEVLCVEQVDRPEPGPTEVLVRVHAASVNPSDAKTRARGRFPVGVRPPFILGFDVAGVVEAIGDGVTIYSPGDRVFGMPRFPHPAGAYAEYVTAPSRHFAPLPAGAGFVDAAAMPLAGLTAWQTLVDTARVSPGQVVLIHAAAGGVGHLAVQIAKALGAEVIATGRPDNHPFLRALGADRCIDYRGDDLRTLRDVDAVLDPVGSATTRVSVEAVRAGGTVVRLPAWTPDDDCTREFADRTGKRLVRLLVEPDKHALEELGRLYELNQLRPFVSEVWPFEQAPRAHRAIETGHTRGKLVLRTDH